jgi:hypothetical protein
MVTLGMIVLIWLVLGFLVALALGRFCRFGTVEDEKTTRNG